MIRALLAAALLLLSPVAALAQSSPGLVYKQVPTPAQWNSYFAAKQDVLGYTPVNRAGDTMSGPLITTGGTVGRAGFTLFPGVAPTSPNNGDMWTTASGLFVRINGTTVGPIATGSGSVTSVICGTGLTGGTITTSGTCAISAPVGIALGGTGQISLTNHGVLIGAGATGITQLGAAAAGTLLTGQGASSDPSFSNGPTLGVAGASTGQLKLTGATSGTVTITPQATAGTATFTLPNASGTAAVSASSPLALSATTGNLTCATCVTSSGGGAISGTAPVAVSAAGAVSVTGAAGQILAGAGPAFTPTPTLGVAGSTLGTLTLSGSTSGTTLLQPNVAASGTLTLPAAIDTLVGKATTDTLTNKTLTAPVMTAPVLGTPASGTLTNATGLPIGTGVAGLGSGIASWLATPSSANLIAAVTDETGSGSLVFATSPTLVTPNLGAASATSLNLSGLTASSAVATDGSKNLVSIANTGSGSNVLATSPTLVTPTLGAATATSINKMAVTAPTTSSTLAVADGKTATVSNTLTFAGTDGTTLTFPSTSATIARTDAANTFTGVQTMTSPAITTPAIAGLATGSGVASAATASTLAARDANANLTANAIIRCYATTVTAAGTTTLTVASPQQQFFTGTTTQTLVLPVTSTLVLGQSWSVINNSSGAVTVQSSGGNTILVVVAGNTGIFNAISLSGTTAASWSSTYISSGAGTGTVTSITAGTGLSGGTITTSGTISLGATTGSGSIVLATSPTMVTPVLGAASATSINFGGSSLSNYVEGSWSPGMSFGGGTAGITYGTQSGLYTRIGRLVCFNGRIGLTSKGSSTGSAKITGLPLAATSSLYAVTVGEFGSGTGLTGAVVGLTDNTATTITLEQSNATGTVTISDAVFTNATSIFFSGCYSV